MKQKNPNSNSCCRYVVGHKGSCWLAFATKNTTHFEVFGASQAKNHGTVTVTVTVTVVVVVVTPAAFFCLVVAENRQIGGVFATVWDSWSKEHRKYRYLLRLGSPKPRYLWCCFFCQQKNTVFTVFFGQHRAKTLVFAQFSACCKKFFPWKKSQKQCI